MGAFTDKRAISSSPSSWALQPDLHHSCGRNSPATRHQRYYYEDNGGAGFVVAINGVNVTVPPTAMPWNWKTGGINNNYQYGINDGTSPVIAAASLTAGSPSLSRTKRPVSTECPHQSARQRRMASPTSLPEPSCSMALTSPRSTQREVPIPKPADQCLRRAYNASGVPIPNTRLRSASPELTPASTKPLQTQPVRPRSFTRARTPATTA